MNTTEAAELTGIPEIILIRMRNRENRSLKSGPPFSKKMDKYGNPFYSYSRRDLNQWMKITASAQLTAGDASAILKMTREELLTIDGLKGFDIRTKAYRGRLIVDNSRNVYIWVSLKK